MSSDWPIMGWGSNKPIANTIDRMVSFGQSYWKLGLHNKSVLEVEEKISSDKDLEDLSKEKNNAIATESVILAGWVDGFCRLFSVDNIFIDSFINTNFDTDLNLKFPESFLIKISEHESFKINDAYFKYAIVINKDQVCSIYIFTDYFNRKFDDQYQYKRYEYGAYSFGCSISSSGIVKSINDFSKENTHSSESESRVINLFGKVALGIIYYYNHTKNWSLGSSLNRPNCGRRLVSGPPAHPEVIISSRNIKFKTKDRIANGPYKEGDKIDYQQLVRGHLKSQPYGPKHSLRKIIWIEPYWKGPEEAPIRVQQHVAV